MWFYPLWTIWFYSRLRCLLPFLLFRQVVLANTRHDEHDFIHYCRLGRYHSDCLTSKHLCQRDMGCRWSACLTRTSFFMSLIRQVMGSLSLGCVITWVVLSTCTYNSALASLCARIYRSYSSVVSVFTCEVHLTNLLISYVSVSYLFSHRPLLSVGINAIYLRQPPASSDRYIVLFFPLLTLSTRMGQNAKRKRLFRVSWQSETS